MKTCHASPKPRESGFTLVELMVVMTIVAVLSAMAAPAMREMVARYQTSVVADQVVTALSTARMEAIRRSGNVVLEKINGTTNPCANNQQWSCGVRLWADVNRNGAREGTDVILREFDVPAGISLLNMSAGSTASLTINRWGQANGINALNFRVTRIGVAVADRSVCVSAGGRIRIVDGIVCP
jgi:type IV fimbrial biogenesis protein FimT